MDRNNYKHVEPLVSVKMLTYNHAPYIAQAIEEVLYQQTNFPFELVIGEDCSTDGTRQIVLEYQNQYPEIIKVVTSDNNVGAHRNSVRTDKVCCGKYIAFCEGDDFWHNRNKLQVQFDFLENNIEYGMVHGNVDVLNVEKGELHKSFLDLPSDLQDDNAYFEILSSKRRIYTPTVMARRTLLLQVIRDNPECSDRRFMMGDFQRWLELSRVSNVKYMPESLATYRILQESASKSNDRNKLLRFEQSIRDSVYHYLVKYDCPKELECQIHNTFAIDVLRVAIYAYNIEAIRSEFEEVCKQKIEDALNWQERLICWGSKNHQRQQLVELFKSLWNFKKYLKSLLKKDQSTLCNSMYKSMVDT